MDRLPCPGPWSTNPGAGNPRLASTGGEGVRPRNPPAEDHQRHRHLTPTPVPGAIISAGGDSASGPCGRWPPASVRRLRACRCPWSGGQPVERAQDVAALYRVAGAGGEDQVCVLPVGARLRAHGLLPHPLPAQRSHAEGRQEESPLTTVLRVVLVVLTARRSATSRPRPSWRPAPSPPSIVAPLPSSAPNR
jgi:hypothetical protein